MFDTLNLLLNKKSITFSQGEFAEEVGPGTNVAGSRNILAGAGLDDFGEKIAQIFGESRASSFTAAAREGSAFHRCEKCEYRSMQVRDLQRHMENRHKSLPEKRKGTEGEKNRVEKRAKPRGQGSEGWKAVKKERILELAPISSDYIQSLTLP